MFKWLLENSLTHRLLVLLTAAVSLSGALAWAFSRFRRSGLVLRKSSSGWLPFFWLQRLQAKAKFETRSVPPRLRTISST